jgi:hypothetical protein
MEKVRGTGKANAGAGKNLKEYGFDDCAGFPLCRFSMRINKL